MNRVTEGAFKDHPGADCFIRRLGFKAGWAETGMGRRQSAAWTDRLRNPNNLPMAIWAPAESRPVTTSTDRWEKPVQTTP